MAQGTICSIPHSSSATEVGREMFQNSASGAIVTPILGNLLVKVRISLLQVIRLNSDANSESYTQFLLFTSLRVIIGSVHSKFFLGKLVLRRIE